MADNQSGLPTDRRENAGADGGRQPISAIRLSQICYILVCLHVLFFGYITIAHPNAYVMLTWEDGWVEYLTAISFLLAGVMLLVSALAERRLFPRCAYILGGLALALFAGEEISWGQRIIGFETPRFLMDLNLHRETNIHNIPNFAVIFQNQKELIFMLGIVGCAAFFCRKDRIFGIPSPQILLTLALLTMMSYAYKGGGDFSNFLKLILSWNRGLLLILLMFALFSRNAGLFIATTASLSLTIATAYLSYQNSHLTFWEPREYLFSLTSFFYALATLLDQGVARQKIAAIATALKPVAGLPFTRITLYFLPINSGKLFKGIKRKGHLTAWMAICALIIAGSVGLAFRVRIDDMVDAAAFRETHSLTRTAEPAARSNFDMYIDGRYLHYFRQPCAEADTKAKFFLGVFPANVDDLRVVRRHYGFENLDFDFGLHGSVLDDACAARVRLPNYEIASISTGQLTVEDGGYTNLWVADFPVGDE